MAAGSDPVTSATVQVALTILTLVSICSAQADAQQAPTHVVIPFLANATKLADLGFEGGECDVDKTGKTMACQFQQVLLTTTDLTPQTCFITTNRYERTFQKQTSTRWVSREGPAGRCGVVDVTTLQDDGGVRWTMETRKVVTVKDASAECRGLDEQSETLSWQNVRRVLPCTFVQPGLLR